MKRSWTQLVDKIQEKIGEEKFKRLILKIYSARVISELNFNKEEIDEAILPLSQLGIIKVEDRYFRERPDKHKTHYNLFSLTDKGKAIAESIMKEVNLPKIVHFFISKYPLKFLAFVVHFLITENKYSRYQEEQYHKLLEESSFADFLQEFKQDLEKHSCGFILKGFTSTSVIGYPATTILLPDFVNYLRKQSPKEIVEKELQEYKLAMYIENYFLKPCTTEDWYDEFLKKVDAEKLKNL